MQYLSFEKVTGIQVGSRQRASVEHQITSTQVPIRYSLKRERYSIAISIDSQSHFPNATFHLEAPGGFRMSIRPDYGMRENRAAPCGSFDDVSEDGSGFVYSWVICDSDRADALELMVAFDVIDATGAVAGEERIPFEVRNAGMYWDIDSV